MSRAGIGARAPLPATTGVPGGGPFGVLADAKVVSSGRGARGPRQAAHPPEVPCRQGLPAGEPRGDGTPSNPCYSTRVDHPHPGPQRPSGGSNTGVPAPSSSPSEPPVTRLLSALLLAAAVGLL